MKINKTTIIVCTILCFLSGGATILLGLMSFQSAKYSMFYGIASSIFTGFIVSVVVSIIGYYHERNIIISNIDNYIQGLYTNMNIVLNTIINVVPVINFTEDLTTLPFKTISGMLELNPKFFSDMQLGLYDPLWSGNKLSIICGRLKELQSATYNIKYSSSAIQSKVLDYKIMCLKLQCKQTKGEWITPGEGNELIVTKNNISILTAKLQASIEWQILELDRIASCFYAFRGRKYSWEKVKSDLQKQAEYMSKG